MQIFSPDQHPINRLGTPFCPIIMARAAIAINILFFSLSFFFFYYS